MEEMNAVHFGRCDGTGHIAPAEKAPPSDRWKRTNSFDRIPESSYLGPNPSTRSINDAMFVNAISSLPVSYKESATLNLIGLAKSNGNKL